MSKTTKGTGELGTKSGQMPFSKVMSQADRKMLILSPVCGLEMDTLPVDSLTSLCIHSFHH